MSIAARIHEFMELEKRATKDPWNFERVGFGDGSFSYEHNVNGTLIVFSELNYPERMRAKFDSEFVQFARNLAPGIIRQLSDALEVFQNRRKLAHSLRAESPHVAAFVEAIGVEIDKILSAQVAKLEESDAE